MQAGALDLHAAEERVAEHFRRELRRLGASERCLLGATSAELEWRYERALKELMEGRRS